jgi:hypothetical protein
MKKFKFELGEKVFILGLAGMVIITGRGRFDFLSGGKLNIYQVQGGRTGYHCEQELLSLEEAKNINEDR